MGNLTKPSIAVVRGIAFGSGCEISLALEDLGEIKSEVFSGVRVYLP